MTLTLDITANEDFNLGEVRDIVTSALERELLQARSRRDAYQLECQSYEERYGITTDAFAVAFEEGTLGDDAYLFDWYGAKQGLDRWNRRVDILTGVTVAPA